MKMKNTRNFISVKDCEGSVYIVDIVNFQIKKVLLENLTKNKVEYLQDLGVVNK